MKKDQSWPLMFALACSVDGWPGILREKEKEGLKTGGKSAKELKAAPRGPGKKPKK